MKQRSQTNVVLHIKLHEYNIKNRETLGNKSPQKHRKIIK